jgi:hypothetical protein
MDGGLLREAVPTPASSASLEELEAQITELAGHLNAAHYRWLTLIAEFDRRQGWADGRLATRWRGERIDYELGVWGLCHQVERARDVSAETSSLAAPLDEG